MQQAHRRAAPLHAAPQLTTRSPPAPALPEQPVCVSQASPCATGCVCKGLPRRMSTESVAPPRHQKQERAATPSTHRLCVSSKCC